MAAAEQIASEAEQAVVTLAAGFAEVRPDLPRGRAEQADEVDRAGVTAVRQMTSLQPARQLILVVSPHTGVWLFGDVAEFLKQFLDYLAPKLDAYEQAIYLYIFRHGRLIGQDEVTIGFKSARKKMAFGIGEKGKPMSESTADRKLRSLQEKGCIEILGVERNGRRIRLILPNEMPALLSVSNSTPSLDLEQMDFFEVPANRFLLLEREQHRCFYCLRKIDSKNYVIEHVVSRPEGDNSYRNLVAACLQCNNRKGSSSAEDFLRTLYREHLLSSDEFEDRLSHLERLRAGDLKPVADVG